MAIEIKKAEYFNIVIDSNAEEAYNLLSRFATLEISLLAFKAIPADQSRTRFSLVPDNSSKMIDGAKKAGLFIDGPHNAIIIKSNNDDPGECAGIFKKLSQVDINVKESSGIADIMDSYGVILYLENEDCEKAMAALKA